MIDKSSWPPNPYASDCPTRRVLDRVADKWTVLILGILARKPTRFNELRRAIDGISQKMLAQTLRTLERDGLVNRKVIATVPVTVEYSITALGRTLSATVDGLRKWAEKHITDVTAAQLRYDKTAARAPFSRAAAR
jgi:DNA-binding HxlR family transcriptional regulator